MHGTPRQAHASDRGHGHAMRDGVGPNFAEKTSGKRHDIGNFLARRGSVGDSRQLFKPMHKSGVVRPN